MSPESSDFAFRRLRLAGRPYVLRPLAPGDEDRLRAFFESHSSETIEDRYGYRVATMTPERAARSVHVDPGEGLALGIFEAVPHGEVLHAVGRFCTAQDGASAELAFVVRETLRKRGMGTTLMEALVEAARSRGLRELWAQVSETNAAMRSLLISRGFNLVGGAAGEGGAVNFHMILAKTCGVPRSRRT